VHVVVGEDLRSVGSATAGRGASIAAGRGRFGSSACSPRLWLRSGSGQLLLDTLAASASAGVAARLEQLKRALAPLIRSAYADGETRMVDLGQLVDAATTGSSLERFVAELVLDPPLSSADYAGPPAQDEDYLVLSTIHSAKGLEWEHGHVIHASDGNIPADTALSTKEDLEEERRLRYVALTRPRSSLSIYVPLRYYRRPRARDDAHGYGEP
jgi:DNA helicase-2/ATP-dependent DNA helicase PcrA